jgi:Ni,Fe-hydrogenase I large subunit
MVSPAERLGARLGEIAEAVQFVGRMERPDHADWITARRLAPGMGFCAIETPRGRLHHLVQLGPLGTVQRYAILAPTEWNFAADGPFAAALRGLWIGTAAARPAIERLASLYDPCVGTAIEVRDFAARGDIAMRRPAGAGDAIHKPEFETSLRRAQIRKREIAR